MAIPNKKCRKVLIVDDEEALAENIAAFLARLPGLEVAVARSGEEAVLEAERFAPHCVVTDYHLPGIDGLETASRIRARDPDTSFVLISGQPSDAMYAEAHSQGVRCVLVKPFPLAQLRDCVNG